MSTDAKEIALDKQALSYQRRDALLQLISENHPELPEVLSSMMDADDQYFRREILKLAATADPSVSRPILLRSLHDENEYVRQDAIDQMQACFQANCLNDLRALQDDPSYSIQSSIKQAFAKFGTELTAREEESDPPPPEPEPEPEPPRQEPELPEILEVQPIDPEPPVTEFPSTNLGTAFFGETLNAHLEDRERLQALEANLRKSRQGLEHPVAADCANRSDLESEVTRRQKATAELRERKQHASNQMDRLTQDIAALGVQQSSPTSKVLKFIRKFREEQEDAMDRSNAEMADLEKEDQRLREELESAETSLREAKDELDALEAADRERKSTVERLSREMDSTRRRIRERILSCGQTALQEAEMECLRQLAGQSDKEDFLTQIFLQWKLIEEDAKAFAAELKKEQRKVEHREKEVTEATSLACDAIASGFHGRPRERSTTVRITGALHPYAGKDSASDDEHLIGAVKGKGQATAHYSLEDIDWTEPASLATAAERLTKSWRILGRAAAERNIAQARMIALREFRNDVVALLEMELEPHLAK